MTWRAAPLFLAVLLALLLTAPAAAAAATTGQQHAARLRIDELRPRLITADGPATLVVTGTVRNTGDVALSGLAVNIGRGAALDGPAGVRAALQGPPSTIASTPFRDLAVDGLAPGQHTTFRIEVTVGTGTASLQIDRRGVYPVVINLNGAVGAGGLTRLDSASVLLPVLTQRSDHAASGLTVVWPLVAQPARLPTRPGEPTLLRGDGSGTAGLIDQIAPGGRLDGLVSAMRQATRPDGPLSAALCVAVDPALLDTVAAMSDGYGVLTPTGRRRGDGAEQARRWLDRLRRLLDERCVLALPYADPDLVALSRAGLVELQALARRAGNRVVEQVLGRAPMTGVSWPAGGVLDPRTLTDLTALGTQAVLLVPRALAESPDQPRGTATVTRVTARSGAQARALLIDPLIRRALSTATGAASVQNALGILAYRALHAPRRPVLLVPPRRWRVSGGQARALLTGIRTLIDARLLRPQPLPSLLAGTGGPARTLDDPQAKHIPPGVTARVAEIRAELGKLQSATRRDPAVDLPPAALFDRVRRSLLRATSTAWRGHPDRARAWVEIAADELRELRSSVQIVPPSGPYTLTSSDSPLLVTVRNRLPVAVAATVHIEPVLGLSTAAPKQVMVPARSSRQVRIPVQVRRTGPVRTVGRLTTPGGVPLGEPVTLALRATSLDGVTLAITGGAAGVLVLLMALRIVRWIRARNTAGASQG